MSSSIEISISFGWTSNNSAKDSVNASIASSSETEPSSGMVIFNVPLVT